MRWLKGEASCLLEPNREQVAPPVLDRGREEEAFVANRGKFLPPSGCKELTQVSSALICLRQSSPGEMEGRMD